MNENKYPYPGYPLRRLQHLLPLLSAVLLLTASGCRREVPNGGRTLKLSFYDASQAGADAIREIEVFVFDAREQLIGSTGTTIDGTLSFDYSQTPALHCIAWGNSKSSSLEITPLQPGAPLDGAFIALTPLPPAKAGTRYLNTPPDLFRGATQIDNNTTTGPQPSFNMEMLPVTASVHITIGGLPETTGTEAGDYAIEVSRTAAHIDFAGHYRGKAVHRLTGRFNAEKEYIIPPFRIFPPPEGKGIRIDISHDGKLLKSITQTSDRRPLIPVAGQELALLITFSPDGDVKVRQPGWNPTDIEVAYP